MSRSRLAEGLVARAGIGPVAARAALDVLFGTGREPGIIAEMMRDGARVQLAGFGTFEARERRARAGFDPRTRTRIVLPASRTPAFRAAPLLRASVRIGTTPAAGRDKDETAATS